METLTMFLRSIGMDSNQGCHKPADDEQARDPETLSASVDLDDIISEYDEPIRQSQCFTHDGQPSQSHFSLSGAIDDETTSFYSAVHDGFSLDQLEHSKSKYDQELLWSESFKSRKSRNSEELDKMLEPSHFQVFWYDLNFTIKPRATLLNVIEEGRQRLLLSVASATKCLSFFRSKAKKYDVNSSENSRASSGDSDAVSILRNVSGSFESGQLSAVMGPSGAGKTSLLNILSRRRESGFTGQVRVSGTSKHVSINAIPQHDHLPECFTVRENLTFAARLKNADQNHATNVQRVGGHLGLSECLDTRTKNLSGGQQKRLAIAQELLSQPGILILDEPTSGLDSLTCLKTLSVLKTLAVASREGEIDPIAIVLTIHQPQQEAFNLFDKVYVMANGGTVIYDGPPGQCERFVERHAGLRMPSADYNPASFLVEIASGEYGHEPIEALARQVRLEHAKIRERASSKNLEGSTLSMGIIERALSVASLDMKRDGSYNRNQDAYLDPKLAKSSSLKSGRFFTKTQILVERCWKSNWRNKRLIFGRVLFFLMLPFGVASLTSTVPGGSNACPRYSSSYSLVGIVKSDQYTSDEIQTELMSAYENTSVLYVLIYGLISANIAAITLVFTLDMKSSLKEYYNGWYSMDSYILGRLISQLPNDLVLCTATIALTYVVTGQNTGNGDMPDVYRILITSLAVIMGSGIGQILGMLFGAVYMDHITTALFASQGATLPFVLLSGFVTRTKNMSTFVRALGLTSLFKHCLDATFIARYGWNVCECDPQQFENKEVQLTGVSEELRNFVKFWMNAQDGQDEIALSSNATQAPQQQNNEDLFQLIAKQLSLYNTYGVEVTSCEQVVPYELLNYGLTEGDLLTSFTALLSIFLVLLIVLLLAVKLVISYRTSL